MKTLTQKSNRAFSLVEISIVILIVGILIAGISKGVDLYQGYKINQARNLTRNSRVGRIPDLNLWLETTAENIFSSGTSNFSDIEEITSDKTINRWKDSNPLSINKNNATQTNSINQPKVIIDQNTLLPVVSFVNSQSMFLNLPDGTVPFGNAPYSIFFVSRTYSLGSFVVLSSGEFGVNNRSNSFRYDVSTIFYNYWWFADIASTNVIKVNQLQIITTTYDLSNRKMYIDGKLNKTVASSNRNSTKIKNTIGAHDGRDYMNGDIAEIIIYERALSDNERMDIESYLSKKWSIDIK